VVLVIHHFVPHLKAVPVEMQILVLQVMALVVVVVRVLLVPLGRQLLVETAALENKIQLQE
jgi:hypothetical protein